MWRPTCGSVWTGNRRKEKREERARQDREEQRRQERSRKAKEYRIKRKAKEEREKKRQECSKRMKEYWAKRKAREQEEKDKLEEQKSREHREQEKSKRQQEKEEGRENQQRSKKREGSMAKSADKGDGKIIRPPQFQKNKKPEKTGAQTPIGVQVVVNSHQERIQGIINSYIIRELSSIKGITTSATDPEFRIKVTAFETRDSREVVMAAAFTKVSGHVCPCRNFPGKGGEQ